MCEDCVSLLGLMVSISEKIRHPISLDQAECDKRIDSHSIVHLWPEMS